MKKILLLALLTLSASWLIAQEDKPQIDWITWQEAEKRMTEEPKKVLVDVYTKWCGPCKMMNKTTFQDPIVVNYVNKNYYAIKFDAEGGETVEFKGTTFKNEGYDPNKTGRNSTHDLTRAIAPVNGRIAYPTIVYMNEDFQIIVPQQGFQKPPQIMPILSFIAEEAYKTQTFQEFTSSN
jgi:thioredoxin-related protein